MRHTFKGAIIDEGKFIRASRFVCFGQMSDGMKCFHEIDADGNEIEGAWYSFSKVTIDGRKYPIFILEGIE